MCASCALSRAAELSIPEEMQAIRSSLAASFELAFAKGVLAKYSENPRSLKVAIGTLTFTISVCDVAWESVHMKVDASSCVWASKGPHRTSKPQFKDPKKSFTPSRLKYEFKTTIALNRLIPWERLIVHAHNGAQGDVVCPFPKAWVHEEVAFTMIGATVLDGIYLQPPLQPVLIKGESGTVIRHSVRSTTAADFAYRWSGSKFEYLIVLDELQWPIWISAQSITVHEPIGIVSRRLHHRMKNVTPFSKKCQEMCTVKFRQSIVNVNMIKLGMLEAQLFHCL